MLISPSRAWKPYWGNIARPKPVAFILGAGTGRLGGIDHFGHFAGLKHASQRMLTLSREERLEPLGVAAAQSGRPVHLLEQDIWVVWALDGLSSSQFGEHLVLGGGTSLSKAYNIIRRLSKDIDCHLCKPAIDPEPGGLGGHR
jgi:hypothetical protein